MLRTRYSLVQCAGIYGMGVLITNWLLLSFKRQGSASKTTVVAGVTPAADCGISSSTMCYASEARLSTPRESLCTLLALLNTSDLFNNARSEHCSLLGGTKQHRVADPVDIAVDGRITRMKFHTRKV